MIAFRLMMNLARRKRMAQENLEYSKLNPDAEDAWDLLIAQGALQEAENSFTDATVIYRESKEKPR